MSDAFYTLVRALGRPVIHATSRPVLLAPEHAARPGPYIIAANHTSPYDIPLLIAHARRKLDFVSIVEVFRNPLLAAFYGSLNAFPLDRSAPDAKTVRVILRRLEQGRVVVIFPEGGFRTGDKSVTHGGPIRPGLARIAALAGVPVVPAVIINSCLYRKPSAWLPLRRVRYGITFGEPMRIEAPPDADDVRQIYTDFENRYQATMQELSQTLAARMRERGINIA